MNPLRLLKALFLCGTTVLLFGGSATAATVTLKSWASPGQYVATPDSDAIWTTQLGQYNTKALVHGGLWVFCLETNEYFNQQGTYNVAFSNTTDGGSGPVAGQPDRISAGTAYLYELFATGTLFPDPAYSLTQGAELQYAIWSLEDEVWDGSPGISPYLTGLLDTQFGIANSAAYKADYTGTNVGVMVLTGDSGGRHQDQLYFHGPGPLRQGNPVPDGGSTLTLLGLGLAGFSAFTKRRRNA